MRYICAEPHACDLFYQHQGAKIRFPCEGEYPQHDDFNILRDCKIVGRYVLMLPLSPLSFKSEIDKILEFGE